MMGIPSHQPCLIPDSERERFGALVFAWLQETLPLYSPSNVRKHGCRWIAEDNCPPGFEYRTSNQYVISRQPPAPTKLIARCNGDFSQVRRLIFDFAENLLAEARPADRERLAQMREGFIQVAADGVAAQSR